MSVIDRQGRVQWFAELSQRLGTPQDPVFNLMTEVKIDEDRLRQMRDATIRYVCAPLANQGDLTSEQAVLEAAGNNLANRTPNGMLMPKQEFLMEFNQLHKVMADWFHSLGIDDLIYQIFCPIVVRLVMGQRNPQEESRPLSSTKLHADIWADLPLDVVAIQIPILGDTERTTIEFLHPPHDFEERYMRLLNDYDEAKEVERYCERNPVAMRLGYAYFYDGIVPHKTVKKQGGARVTVQLEFLKATTDVDRREIEKLRSPSRLALYVDGDEWYEYGSTKFLKFRDTYADAEKGIFPERSMFQREYEVVDSL